MSIGNFVIQISCYSRNFSDLILRAIEFSIWHVDSNVIKREAESQEEQKSTAISHCLDYLATVTGNERLIYSQHGPSPMFEFTS